MANFVNLTPHTINVVGDVEMAIAPSGNLARCREVSTSVGNIDGVPLVSKTFGTVEGLPEAQDGTIYIVSALVLAALKGSGRTDVVCPGDPVRNDAGQIIGCRSFCC
jgi:hypothetical protein